MTNKLKITLGSDGIVNHADLLMKIAVALTERALQTQHRQVSITNAEVKEGILRGCIEVDSRGNVTFDHVFIEKTGDS